MKYNEVGGKQAHYWAELGTTEKKNPTISQGL